MQFQPDWEFTFLLPAYRKKKLGLFSLRAFLSSKFREIYLSSKNIYNTTKATTTGMFAQSKTFINNERYGMWTVKRSLNKTLLFYRRCRDQREHERDDLFSEHRHYDVSRQASVTTRFRWQERSRRKHEKKKNVHVTRTTTKTPVWWVRRGWREPSLWEREEIF